MSTPNGVRVNVHMYPSPFTHETRILRITRSLAERRVFDHILVVAALRGDQAEHEALDDVRAVWRVRTTIARTSFAAKILNTVEWSGRVLWGLRGQRIACLNAHSLSVLPLAVLLSFIKRCRLVYDAHEIETETTETVGIRRSLSRAMERIMVRWVDAIALTSAGHADWYRKAYPAAAVWVVRNCPYRSPGTRPAESYFRRHFSIPDEHLVFLYQGAIAAPRGTDLLLDVFSQVPGDRHIVFMGFGEGAERVREHASRYPHIHYHPAVAPGEVFKYTAGADVGVHMMDDSCINHLYALPNKPMEYMNAGLPAIVSDLPVMGGLIRDAGAGWVVPVGDGQALRTLVTGLDRAQVRERAARAAAWAAVNTWEAEERILVDLYASLGLAAAGS